MRAFVPGLVALVALAGLSAAADVRPRGHVELRPIGYGGVRLAEGPLRTQQDAVKEYYLRIPNDDLLLGFRARAGRLAPGRELGGWYSGDIFHVFGQILSGLSRMYAATGDEACREKLTFLIDEWAKCIEPDGYFFYSRSPNATHYIYEKLVGGLVDALVYAGCENAREPLGRITQWAEKNLGRERPYLGSQQENEWYTLSENLYRAYLATGDAVYRDFAKVWEYTEHWGIYARGDSLFDPRPNGGVSLGYHAYSHVNSLSGLGAAYLVTGEPGYLQTLGKAFDSLQRTQVLPTGGYGPDESLLPANDRRSRLFRTHNSFETQCGSWAAFKAGKYLMTATGEARYGDWVERLLYNGIGAEIPMDAEGNTFYYSDYSPGGGRKVHTGGAWPCCAGTHIMAVADYNDLIYFAGDRLVAVNLFVPSTAEVEVDGRAVRIAQETRFPERDETTLRIDPEEPLTFELRIRQPEWLARPLEIEVNGHELRRFDSDKGWAVVRRRWRADDCLTVRLPMSLWSSPMTAEEPLPAGVLCGPVVLCARADDSKQLAALDLDRLDEELTPCGGEPLTYRMADDPTVLFRPFYAFEEGEPYFMWVAPDLPLWIGVEQMELTGEWPVNTGYFRASPNAEATVGCTFDGERVSWIGMEFDDAGIAEVSIDGQVVALVDQYGPTRGMPWQWDSPPLGPGPHTIQIRNTEERHADSKGTYINIGGLEVRR